MDDEQIKDNWNEFKKKMGNEEVKLEREAGGMNMDVGKLDLDDILNSDNFSNNEEALSSNKII